jgi:hypothetical protein
MGDAVEGSEGVVVAALKEHPLMASEIDAERHSPAHLNIPPVSGTPLVGKDEPGKEEGSS